MKLADVITADDVTAEGLAILRKHWLPYVTAEAPAKFSAALELAAIRLEAIAAGRMDDAHAATVAINLLVENVEASAAYRLQGTVADIALWVLKIAGTAVVKVVVP